MVYGVKSKTRGFLIEIFDFRILSIILRVKNDFWICEIKWQTVSGWFCINTFFGRCLVVLVGKTWTFDGQFLLILIFFVLSAWFSMVSLVDKTHVFFHAFGGVLRARSIIFLMVLRVKTPLGIFFLLLGVRQTNHCFDHAWGKIENYGGKQFEGTICFWFLMILRTSS